MKKEQTIQGNFYRSIIMPLIIVALMWGVFLWEQYFHVSFNSYGIYPRDFVGLRGVLFAPFIHGDLEHIANNTYPVLILGTAIFYFYRKVAGWVYLYSLLMTGIWVWAMARPSFHIGISGVIYAWGSFLLASGFYNKNTRMMSLSFLIVFLYGSMIWGVLPIIPGVSWESHLFGAIAGWLIAYFFRKDGPQRKKYSWETKEEEYEVEFWNMTATELQEYHQNKRQEKTSSQRPEVIIKYDYKAKDPD